MLEAYTWSQFFIFLAVGLIVYYGFVALYFYSSELSCLLFKAKQPATSPVAQAPAILQEKETDYSRYAPPVSTQTYQLDEQQEQDDEEPQLSELTDTDLTGNNDFDWEDPESSEVQEEREPTPEDLAMLQQIDVQADSEDSAIEGGVPADQYTDATDEIQKDNIQEERKEVTKAVLRRAYFNTSFIDLHQINSSARTNIDTMLLELRKEGKISEAEVSTFHEYAAGDGSEDQDIKALLETLNS